MFRNTHTHMHMHTHTHTHSCTHAHTPEEENLNSLARYIEYHVSSFVVVFQATYFKHT